MAYESCSFGQQENSNCGRYPTCKKNTDQAATQQNAGNVIYHNYKLRVEGFVNKIKQLPQLGREFCVFGILIKLIITREKRATSGLNSQNTHPYDYILDY